MKYLLLFSFVFTPFACIADCYESFSQGQDSISYQVTADQMSGDFDRIEMTAKEALGKLFVKFNCTESLVKQLACRRILKGQPESDVCYARSEFGYFVMNKDYLGNVNVVFNRFD